MIEVVAIVLGVFCAAIFVAHAVDAFLAPLYEPATECPSLILGRPLMSLPQLRARCRRTAPAHP